MLDVACGYINVVHSTFHREALINAQGNIALASKMKTKRKRRYVCFHAQNQTGVLAQQFNKYFLSFYSFYFF